MDGIIIIDKPCGPTSHDVCQKVKRILGCKKVGHTGTLDPIASGVLPLLIDGATKWAPRFAFDDKEYLVEACFGSATTTYDIEGEVTSSLPVPSDLEKRVRGLLPGFVGKILQTPPPYSAVKHNGKPLYWWARRGRQVEVPPRAVDVRHFALIVREHRNDKLAFRIICSKGTYVRSLVHELGQAIGCGAHVTQLRRLRSGPFTIDQAVSLEAVGAID